MKEGEGTSGCQNEKGIFTATWHALHLVISFLLILKLKECEKSKESLH